jgi:cell wall-associated NlpC family hydrolase
MGRALGRAMIGIAAVVTVTFGVVVTLLFFSTTNQSGTGGQGTALCLSNVVGVGSVQALDADQLANANTIVAVGRTMQVPVRAVVVALATAMQESALRNLPYGDRDSVGLFQQRPSAGWGTVAELTTPDIAARKFYTALLQVPGWDAMPVTDAAQQVQHSAFPTAYAKWEALATAIVQVAAGGSAGGAAAGGAASASAGGAGAAAAAGGQQLTCGESIGFSVPSGAVGDMLQAALAQQGKPYVWGATGPDAFDCSGLVVYSWRVAGYRSSVRTSEQMYAVSDPVPAGQEQPGDLVFGEFTAAGPGHVMIVVRPGVVVEAPQTGDVVKVIPFTPGGGWVVGRLRAGVLTPIATGTPAANAAAG